MAIGARRPAGAATGPHTPPRLVPDGGGAQSPTTLTSPVRYPPPFTASALADAAGVVTFALDPVPNGELWEIELIRVVSDSAAASAASVYDSAVSSDGLLDRTAAGNFNVLEGLPPWRLAAGARLIVQWTGLDASTARANLRVQYRVLGAS